MHRAKWIWLNDENQANTWMCFVKDFHWDGEPGDAKAILAVDSKYWLYINGKLAVFEGGVKRGQTPCATSYDEVDLERYLTKGRNRIAVLVWFFGKSGFSHVSSGRGGLYFDMSAGAHLVCSDGSWKAKKHPAYVAAPADDIGPNFRLPESDIYFDAALDIGSWYAPDYPVDEWADADVLTDGEAEAFGALVPRKIPMFKDAGIREFVNSDSVKGLWVEQDTVIEMRLPYNLQFTPCLTLEAPAGKQITIKGEMYHTNAPGENCLKSVYCTREGCQAYEALGWLNGEKISFEIPSGVRIINLQYRETGYDTDQAGRFSCDDEFLNRLWRKSWRTLYISMRDTFMDCPDRERTQWWGDANIEMQMLLYCMDQKAEALYRTGVDSLVNWYEATGRMLTVVPSGTIQFELPFQNMSGIYGFMLFYRHTGDKAFVRQVYPMCRDYVRQYIIGEDRLVLHREGSWDWPDWGSHADLVIMENAWYILALNACFTMAEALEEENDLPEFHARRACIREGLRAKVNAEGAFYDNTDNGIPDDRANALAILAGVADRQPDAAAAVLMQVENASPYMEKYVLDALCEMGRIDDALARMKRRYAAMVEDDYSTLWELWNKECSLNHGWSGGPLVTMSRYIAGVSVENADENSYRIKPHLGSLKWVECTVPTGFGPLSVRIERKGLGGSIEVIHPQEIKVKVQLTELCDTELEAAAWNIHFRNM